VSGGSCPRALAAGTSSSAVSTTKALMRICDSCG
jgi:hypothetical protein